MTKAEIIRDLRISKKLTQEEAASLVGLSLRTYQNYEYGASTRDTFKINFVIKLLKDYERITETKGILTLNEIKSSAKEVFDSFNIEYAFLFGDYSTSRISEDSDIKLLISGTFTGLELPFIESELKGKLHKKISLLTMSDQINNPSFLNEILKTGIRIYSKEK